MDWLERLIVIKRLNEMIKKILILSILSLLHLGCHIDTSGQYSYLPPEKIKDGLDVGSLKEVSIDVNDIEHVVNLIKAGRYKEVHSMLIFKDVKLVFEE